VLWLFRKSIECEGVGWTELAQTASAAASGYTEPLNSTKCRGCVDCISNFQVLSE
jgi:hypothetical protein